MNDLLNQLMTKVPCKFYYNLDTHESEIGARLMGTLQYNGHTIHCTQSFSRAATSHMEDMVFSIYNALFARLKDKLAEELKEKLADKPESNDA